MSEDQKPVAPAETTATSENTSQPEQPVAAATPITPPSSKLIPTAKRTLDFDVFSTDHRYRDHFMGMENWTI
jgi:hypothetical protein